MVGMIWMHDGNEQWVQRHSDCQIGLSGVALTDTDRDDSTGTTRGLSNAAWPLYPLPETLAGGCDTKWEFMYSCVMWNSHVMTTKVSKLLFSWIQLRSAFSSIQDI